MRGGAQAPGQAWKPLAEATPQGSLGLLFRPQIGSDRPVLSLRGVLSALRPELPQEVWGVALGPGSCYRPWKFRKGT